MDDAAIRDTLRAGAAPFSTAPPPPDLPLVYAPLFAALAPGARPDVYPPALELVYEGYLAHYRIPRLLPADTPLTTRLLAGDQFDADGLRLVARVGDLDAVALLTRLMASCSWLRSEGAPLSHDDDLWLLAVAGMASSASGGNGLAALRVFDAVAAACRRDRVDRLPAIVRRGAATIWLRRPSPLRVALGLEAPEGEQGGGDPGERATASATDPAAPPGDHASPAQAGAESRFDPEETS